MAEAKETIPVATLPPIFSQLPPISVKLTDGNFLMWQQQVDIAVYGYGLEAFITGETDPPPRLIPDQDGESMVSNPAFTTWQRQDRRVAGWLLSSLSENALTLVVGLRSARDIWCALETNFASRSTAKVMQYSQQMQNLKKDALSMTEYLGKMRTYFDLLGTVGCRILEAEQVLHIMGGLGQEYNPTVCAVTSRSDPWSIGDVSAFLLSFESRMESTRANSISSDGSQPSLNMLQQQSGQKRDQPNHNNNKFEAGSGRGFGGRNQRGGRGGRGYGRGGNKIVCQLCEKPGHSAAKCWHRFEQDYTPPQVQYRGNAPQH